MLIDLHSSVYGICYWYKRRQECISINISFSCYWQLCWEQVSNVIKDEIWQISKYLPYWYNSTKSQTRLRFKTLTSSKIIRTNLALELVELQKGFIERTEDKKETKQNELQWKFWNICCIFCIFSQK